MIDAAMKPYEQFHFLNVLEEDSWYEAMGVTLKK